MWWPLNNREIMISHGIFMLWYNFDPLNSCGMNIFFEGFQKPESQNPNWEFPTQVSFSDGRENKTEILEPETNSERVELNN